ncbi:ATP-binding protein [Ramlibacter tataouinensis]|uniref:ATP-binding protein n=1 Tax=Ramlibacter tataouinensis TaxID=94132 RepID=UPI00030B709D|nr:ATP-binding protein [Ramlibacter tataouinensis]
MEALADTPVVLLHGPRQSGKTSLARAVAEPAGYGYLSFDDDNLLAAARTDPVGFVADLPPRMVLDEIQRIPEIFTSLKASVDKDRRPGRFLLTGSANVLLLPALADSLAGRLEAQRLHPLAQCEIERRPGTFLHKLFGGRFAPARHQRLGLALAQRIVAGGYPAALARSENRRRAWYQAYVQALVQRDVRDLARISALDALPRLLEFAAAQTARLFNLSELAGPFQLSRPTIRDYLILLERLFLLETLPPWHLRQLPRLVKTPKIHLGDTGLACALLRVDAAEVYQDRTLLGQLAETFVFQELRRQASWQPQPVAFHHFRDRDDHEVDIVLERGPQELAGVEVKASSTVREADFRGLRKLREVAGPRWRCGIVMYDGDAVLRFGPDLLAVPMAALWEAA